MSRVSIKFVATVLLAAFASVPSSSFAESAKDNYRFYCAQCHGLSGKGNGPNARDEMPVSPRNHTSKVEMKKLTDEEILSVIRHGGEATSKSSVMPSFSKTLTEAEIKALKDYLRQLCAC
jgi:mono/diheme cytochrome c family protein